MLLQGFQALPEHLWNMAEPHTPDSGNEDDNPLLTKLITDPPVQCQDWQTHLVLDKLFMKDHRFLSFLNGFFHFV